MSAGDGKRSILFWLAALILAVGLGVLVCRERGVVLPPLARWLDVGESPTAVDFVVSLPGDEKRRPFVAAALVNVGVAQKVLVPHTESEPEVQDGIQISCDQITHRVLRCRGVPEDKIVILQGDSHSTATDVAQLARYLKDHPDSKLAVVTSAFHTRRARLAVRAGLGTIADRVIMVSAPNPDFDTDRWWETEAGFRTVPTEYVKLVAYWLIYGTGVRWLVGGAACMAVWYVARRRRKPEAGCRMPDAGCR
jgi:uncharacterized SAM-binding protein YcdF (DUF218 family)